MARIIACWSIARGWTLPFVGSFTHRPRRIPGDSRCPADRSHDNNFVPIAPCHSRGVRPMVRGCLTPRVVAPPPRYRAVWPSAQSSPSTGKSRELHPLIVALYFPDARLPLTHPLERKQRTVKAHATPRGHASNARLSRSHWQRPWQVKSHLTNP